MKLNKLDPKVIERMSKADRLALNLKTSDELEKGIDRKLEADLHNDCVQELNRIGWWHVSSRTDKKTRQRKGIPDLICCDTFGQFWAFELKVGCNKESPEQKDEIQSIKDVGGRAFVITSLGRMINKIKENAGCSV